jgi:hypothetical protein
MLRILLVTMILTCLCGCGGDAGVELAASDALSAVADQMQLTVNEYHRDVARYDDTREDATVAAFVARVQAARDDPDAVQADVKEFQAALRKIRDDRETEWQRRSAAMGNVAVLREVAGGLQKLALESLSLRDEVRRYIGVWIENQRRARTDSAAVANQPGGNTQ